MRAAIRRIWTILVAAPLLVAIGLLLSDNMPWRESQILTSLRVGGAILLAALLILFVSFVPNIALPNNTELGKPVPLPPEMKDVFDSYYDLVDHYDKATLSLFVNMLLESPR